MVARDPSRDKTSDKISRIPHDEVAFEEFYREHVDGVQRFIARRVHDPCEAADLTAKVFLAAIEGAAGYDPGRGIPTAWMYGVARNVVAAEHRRVTREQNLQTLDAGQVGDGTLVIEASGDDTTNSLAVTVAEDTVASCTPVDGTSD